MFSAKGKVQFQNFTNKKVVRLFMQEASLKLRIVHMPNFSSVLISHTAYSEI